MPTRAQRAPVHGREHDPLFDPIFAGDLVVVGSGLAIPGCGWWTDTSPPVLTERIAPAYLNGWTNIGSGYLPTSFRIAFGPMNMVDRTGTLVEHYAYKQLEFFIAVAGGTPRTAIFQLPPEFWLQIGGSIPYTGHNAVGAVAPFHLTTDGFLMDGVI